MMVKACNSCDAAVTVQPVMPVFGHRSLADGDDAAAPSPLQLTNPAAKWQPLGRMPQERVMGESVAVLQPPLQAAATYRRLQVAARTARSGPVPHIWSHIRWLLQLPPLPFFPADR